MSEDNPPPPDGLPSRSTEKSFDLFDSPQKDPSTCVVGRSYHEEYTRQCSNIFHKVSSLVTNDRKLLRYLLNAEILDTDVLCSNHLPQRLENANLTSRSRYCIDPLRAHPEKKFKKKKTIGLQECEKFEELKGVIVKPGLGLCKTCFSIVNIKPYKECETHSDSLPSCSSSVVLKQESEGPRCFAGLTDPKEFSEKCSLNLTLRKDMAWDESEILRFIFNSEIPPESVFCDIHKPLALSDVIALKKGSQVCCNPFKTHEVRVQARSHADLSSCLKLESNQKLMIKPGQGLCKRCAEKIDELEEPKRPRFHTKRPQENPSEEHTSRKKLKNEEQQCSEEQSEVVISQTPPMLASVDLNAICKLVGVDETKMKDLRSKQNFTQAQQKYEAIKSKLKEKIRKAYDLQEEQQLEDELKGYSKENMEALLREIQSKILKEVKFYKKLQLLTLVPLSWSVQETSSYFSVSKYAVRLSKQLRRQHGILALPGPKKAMSISPEVKELVLQMYESEEFARDCPGAHQSVRVGNASRQQRKLLLCSIDELYAKFKEMHTEVKIGRSKFYEMRPKWCVHAGTSGTHSVCVCKYHENFKLCLNAAGFERQEINSFEEEAMCPEKTRECYLRNCEKCPKLDEVRERVKQRIMKKLDPMEETYGSTEEVDSPGEREEYFTSTKIKFKQWISTDRSELVFKEATFADFSEEVTKQLIKLVPHDYHKVQQACYFKSLKENLNPFKIIAVLDFAENYTYTVQDEIPGHYFDKQGLSIHPVVIYYEEAGAKSLKSLCYVSDDKKHDVAFVQILIKSLTSYIHEKFPFITEIEYFSDGCGAQYKNCKNFLYLCKHEENYGLRATWSFFATSHGKSSCDAIGGRVKGDAKLESLRRVRVKDAPINSLEEFMNFCKTKENAGSKISHFLLDKKEIEEKRHEMEAMEPETVQGTQSFHCFVPLSLTVIGCKRISCDVEFSLVFDLSKKDKDCIDSVDMNCYVACVMDHQWVPAFITHVDNVAKEVEGITLSPISTRKGHTFEWPEYEEPTSVPFAHILGEVQVEIKDNFIEVKNVREIGKKYTTYKRKIAKQNVPS